MFLSESWAAYQDFFGFALNKQSEVLNLMLKARVPDTHMHTLTYIYTHAVPLDNKNIVIKIK